MSETETPKSGRDLGRDAAFGWQTWIWGRLQNEHGKQPVYLYYFDQAPVYPENSPKFGHGSPHGQDTDYVFGTLRNPRESDIALSEYMIKYWTNFAKYMNPNGDGSDASLPSWPLFKNDNSEVMVLTGDKPHPSPVVDEKSLWVLEDYFAWRRSQE